MALNFLSRAVHASDEKKDDDDESFKGYVDTNYLSKTYLNVKNVSSSFCTNVYMINDAIQFNKHCKESIKNTVGNANTAVRSSHLPKKWVEELKSGNEPRISQQLSSILFQIVNYWKNKWQSQFVKFKIHDIGRGTFLEIQTQVEADQVTLQKNVYFMGKCHIRFEYIQSIFTKHRDTIDVLNKR